MGFRARGIKLDLASSTVSEKKYYDPIDKIYSLHDHVISLSQKMKILEYSINEKNEIDSINFHTDCNPIDDCLITKCSSPIQKNICQIFDASYKAYTLGLRFKNFQIKAESIYYYPTIWKGSRFGISGLTNYEEILAQINRFSEALLLADDSKDLLLSLSHVASKFKGICITTERSKSVSYKLYYRIRETNLKKLFISFYDFEKYNHLYGDIVLMAVRITFGTISGYNFYYLR